jgi:hypothetical protein
MYKKKYLKYKKKYLDFKLHKGGNLYAISYDNSNKLTPLECEKDKKLNFFEKIIKKFNKEEVRFNNDNFNIGLKVFNIKKVLCLLQKNLFNSFNFDNIDLLSIGSGNGLFESMCQTIFGIPIICVDPKPPQLKKVEGEVPFLTPMFSYTEEYVNYDKKKKKDETILFLIWPEPDKINVDDEENYLPYDFEAIFMLQPLAFFIIYSDTGFIAGSSPLHEKIIEYSFKIGQEYRTKLKRIVTVNLKFPYSLLGPEGVVKIALFINEDKYQLEKNKSKYYKPSFIENYEKVDIEHIDLGDFPKTT